MKHSFEKIWCVSAYKGAGKLNACCTSLLQRLENHSFWIEKALEHNCFEGIILTGWSRFCHQLVLCEIFPVSIHALTICLKVVKNTDVKLNGVYNELKKLGIYGRNVLRNHEEIFMQEGREGLLKAKLFEKKEGELVWCNDCYEMGWELEKARILYKIGKKEAQQYIHMNYAIEPKAYQKQNSLFRKKSYDSISNPLEELHSTLALPKLKRYNIRHKKEIIGSLQQCLSIVTREEERVHSMLSNWIYDEDIEDFKNVKFPIICRT